jgi:hypothetical protein
MQTPFSKAPQSTHSFSYFAIFILREISLEHDPFVSALETDKTSAPETYLVYTFFRVYIKQPSAARIKPVTAM